MKRRLTLLALAVLVAVSVLDGAQAGWTEPHFSAALGWAVALIFRWSTPE